MRIATELSIETKALADRLRHIQVGETIEYSKLDAELMLETRGDARHAMRSARKILLREGIRFDTVKGVGLKRMTDSEIAKSGSRSVRLVNAMAKREVAKMSAVANFDALTNEEKIQHHATLSVLGAVAHFSKPAQVKILEGAVAAAKSWLPTKETLDVIRRSLVKGGEKK